MAKKKNLSALEKLLLGIEQPKPPRITAPLKKGAPCPQCGKGILDYDGLLQLACPCCGFASGEAGGCT